MTQARRFPPPWSAEDIGAAFVVKDGAGRKLAYVYFDDPRFRGQAAHERRSTKDCLQYRQAVGAVTAGHRQLEPVSATKRAENGTGTRSIIRLRGATAYAFIHSHTVRSCRGDRDSRVLCRVPCGHMIARASNIAKLPELLRKL